jgi:hypothetical protein
MISVHLADVPFMYVDGFCHLSHLKSPDDFGLLFPSSCGGIRHRSLRRRERMNKRLLTGLTAAVLGATVALASPALARGGHGGGGHGGGMHGGAMHGGGMHGGMHAMGGGPRFSGAGLAGPRFAHAGFAPRFGHAGRFAHAGFHRPFFHHRFHHRRFAFIGAPYLYAGYNYSCWRRVWTAYGLRWVNYCDYGYGYY